MVGLLGENGSGKTTTINLIVGALVPNEGTVRVLDVDPLEMPPAVRARIGYLADEVELPNWMKLHEAMEVHSSYFQNWDSERAWRLIEQYELDLGQPFGTLSKGPETPVHADSGHRATTRPVWCWTNRPAGSTWACGVSFLTC